MIYQMKWPKEQDGPFKKEYIPVIIEIPRSEVIELRKMLSDF